MIPTWRALRISKQQEVLMKKFALTLVSLILVTNFASASCLVEYETAIAEGQKEQKDSLKKARKLILQSYEAKKLSAKEEVEVDGSNLELLSDFAQQVGLNLEEAGMMVRHLDEARQLCERTAILDGKLSDLILDYGDIKLVVLGQLGK
jgi:hypothetical protein